MFHKALGGFWMRSHQFEDSEEINPKPPNQILFSHNFSGIPFFSGALVALIGAGYLVAWLTGYFSRPGFRTLTIKTNTAVSLVLCGLAVILMALPLKEAAGRWIVRACALVALFIGALTVCENLFGWNFAIDQVLATEPPGAVQTISPNRMSMLSAAGCVLAATAILLFELRHRRAVKNAQKLAFAVSLLGLTGTIDFLYDVFLTHDVHQLGGIAAPTALAYLVLGPAMLILRPNEGLIAPITAADIGGRTIRFLLPWCIGLPVLFGYLFLLNARTAAYPDTSAGGTVLALMLICVFSILIYKRGASVSQKEAAERQNRMVVDRQAALIDLSPDAIIVRNLRGTITFWSKGAETLYGWSKEEAIHKNVDSLPLTVSRKQLEDIVRQLQDGRDWKGELVQQTKDGRKIVVRSSWHGEVTGNEFEILESNLDITERKSIELELQASEERFRRIYESNMIGIAFWHEDGRLTEANEAYCNLIGCTPQDIRAGRLSWRDVTAPEQLAQAQRSIEEINATGVSTPYEKEFLHHDGHRIPALVGGAMLEGIKGQGVAFAIDISQQKRAEEALRKSEARYRTLFESIDEGFCLIKVLFGENGRVNDILFLDANPAFERQSGLYQVIGKRLGDLKLTAEDGWQDVFGNLATRGGAARFVKYARALSRTLDMYAFRIGDPAEHNLALLFTDVSDRKRMEDALRDSEVRYRSLFESIDEGFCIMEMRFDENGRPHDLLIQEVNPAFERHTGLRQVAGKTIRELGLKLEAGWSETYSKLMATGEALRTELYSETLQRWFDLYAFRTGDPALSKLAILFRNITKRKQAEEELAAAKDAAERANRAKDHFLAVLSHELRTPLTPVIMGLSMLQSKPEIDSSVRETLETIQGHAEMESRLVDDLLDVTRIAHGRIPLHRTPVELSTIIQGAVDICKPDIEARKLHFGVDMGKGGEYWIQADAARLQQVIWNLLKNAIKFTPQGGCVGIRCRPNARHIFVEVNDTGIGIEPESLSSIFKAFEQAEQGRQFGGLGLGLAISKALVELHEGTIRAYSSGPGKGASFVIELPLTAPQQPVTSEKVEAPQHIRPLHILLVEDHGVSAKMIGQVLREEGHRVEIEGAVADALEAADREPFDLLLSDLGLPDGTGYELMEQLRSRGCSFPAIALSGYGQEEDIQQSYQSGFAAHMTKPVSRQRLMEVVGSVVLPRTQKKRIRVLLVDDHETFRRGIARILRAESDVEVAGEAGDGESAVNLTRKIKPDVVLMDILMPGMDGIQATRAIHQELPKIRIIALSMKERSEIADVMRAAGAVSCLTKAESSPDTMLSEIRACV